LNATSCGPDFALAVIENTTCKLGREREVRILHGVRLCELLNIPDSPHQAQCVHYKTYPLDSYNPSEAGGPLYTISESQQDAIGVRSEWSSKDKPFRA